MSDLQCAHWINQLFDDTCQLKSLHPLLQSDINQENYRGSRSRSETLAAAREELFCEWTHTRYHIDTCRRKKYDATTNLGKDEDATRGRNTYNIGAEGTRAYRDEDRRLMINYFLERTSGQLTSTGAASKRTVGPSRSLIVQNWRKIALPTRDTKAKKKPPGVSETTMAYFKVAFVC